MVEAIKDRNEAKNDALTLKGMSLIVTFTALVFLSTSLFYLGLSSTGFFNLGEVFVYLAALIGGPIVGMIAGGVGAAMADLALGYGIFAPATLILKGLEGFVVGYLFQQSKKYDKRIKYAVVGVIAVFMVVFSSFFVRTSIIGAFVIHTIGSREITFTFPGFILLIIAVLLSTSIVLISVLLKEKGDMALACFSGGLIIVVGYFLYEIAILGITFGAAASEVPFNFAQIIFGAAIAIPIVSYLRELGIIEPGKEEKENKTNTDEPELKES